MDLELDWQARMSLGSPGSAGFKAGLLGKTLVLYVMAVCWSSLKTTDSTPEFIYASDNKPYNDIVALPGRICCSCVHIPNNRTVRGSTRGRDGLTEVACLSRLVFHTTASRTTGSPVAISSNLKRNDLVMHGCQVTNIITRRETTKGAGKGWGTGHTSATAY